MSQKNPRNGCVLPRLEELESRHLPSVVVNPFVVNLKTTSHGNGVFTVRVLGDDAAAQALLSSGATLVFQVTDAGGKTVTLSKPLSVRLHDQGGGGITEEVLKFRRSALQGLSAGEAKITVSRPASTTTGTGTTTGTTTGSTTTGSTTGSTPGSETGTFFLFTPGGKDRPGHQGAAGGTGGQQPGGHGKHG
jgi:hypothetical protein